ncbi:esterase family protein [Actinoplanes sp. CA-142083]|uniref:esterase family protein n=1 Tax=Actinoplanes sp. CA-142083 TaxID=3239903 RepID=UPI003D94A205
MRHYSAQLSAPDGATATVAAYGHWGRPVLVFPTEKGNAWEWANTGMVATLEPLLEAGRLKLYCVDSFDAGTWSDEQQPLEERARRHDTYEKWILNAVVPHIRADSGEDSEIVTAGCSLGAFHALNFSLRRADLFPLALCFSGNYEPVTWRGSWGERGDAFYFNSPADYAANLHGDHLDWLRSRVSVLLVCGQGQWEDTTGSLASTPRMAEILKAKGIRCELDMWGPDVPHDWPSWRAQAAHHLPRFC